MRSAAGSPEVGWKWFNGVGKTNYIQIDIKQHSPVLILIKKESESDKLITFRDISSDPKQKESESGLTLSGAGGEKHPPLSYFCDSPKKIDGKSCQVFLTFPKYENGRLVATFFQSDYV